MFDRQLVEGSTRIAVISDSLLLIDDSTQSSFEATQLYRQLSNFVIESKKCALNSIELVVEKMYPCLQDYFSKLTKDPSFVQILIVEFTKHFNEYFSKSILTEDEAINLVKKEPYNDSYAYTILNLSGKCEGDFCHLNYVVDSVSLDQFNIDLLKNHPVSEEHFIARSELMFDNLQFHPNTAETLKTVRTGTFKDHTFQIVQSLQTLGYSQSNLSPCISANDADRTQISSWSSKYGANSLSCTGQGSNKPRFNFLLSDSEDELSINCESHLKLNFNNNGEKIEERDERGSKNNRLYFGIHMHNGTKKLLVAHIGEHL